jgi:hypothetical protein
MIFVKASFSVLYLPRSQAPAWECIPRLEINEANYTVVLVGEEANKQHSDHKEIGCKNWLNYEVAKSKQHRKLKE